MIDLSLPAGNLENALIALRSGADSVYFGLKKFSARKGATNFSEEDLSKIKEFSVKNNKKIYVALNTLVKDQELSSIFNTLEMLSSYSPDGIIVQDLGIVNLIKKEFPSLPLHASTQLAAYNTDGVKYLRDLGFNRVVLSRELSLKEIEKIRNEVKDVELKVFIHGAMCYGFSGLCMASYLKTGRSANKGECAQICRTYFTDTSNNKTFYPFSLKDLCLKDYVKKLRDIEIDALKIEGRLKGSQYVKATAEYYRAILDDKDDEALLDNVLTSFSRDSSSGYINYLGPNHDNLNNTFYPGHLGKELGKVTSINGKTITISERIKDHDGLMVFEKGSKEIKSPFKFTPSVKTPYSFTSPTPDKFYIGQEVYLISDSNQNVKSPSLSLPLYKKEEEIDLKIKDSSIIVSAYEFPAQVEAANKSNNEIERIFSQSGDAPFKPKLSIENLSSYKSPYISPKVLKSIRREAYSLIKHNETKKEYEIKIEKNIDSIILPSRSLIKEDQLPFSISGVFIDGRTYFSIPPLIFNNEESIINGVIEKAKASINPIIGLNNISHIEMAKKHPEFDYFVDIYLYLSNREAASLLLNEIPNLKGGYLYLEDKEYEEPYPFTPTIVKDFTPPLFISRSCYRHDSLNLKCNGCNKNHTYSLKQNDKNYKVIVKDCITYLLSDS